MTKAHDNEPVSHAGQWLPAAVAATFLFGIALCFNTHPLADGSWFWYADALHRRLHLYGDLRLPLQPLYPLEVEWSRGLLGAGWVAGKVAGVMHLMWYCACLWLIGRRLPLRDFQRGLLVLGAACANFFFAAFRLDDFHILADCLLLSSAVLLLRLRRQPDGRDTLWIAAALGLLSGLAVVTRANDGAMQLVAVALALLAIAPRKKLPALGCMAVCAAVAVLGVVWCTGDSPRAWIDVSLLHAAQSKGGGGRVLVHLLSSPRYTLHTIKATRIYWPILLAVGVLSACVVRLAYGRHAMSQRDRGMTIAGGVLSFAVLVAAMLRLDLVLSITAVWSLVMTAAGVAILVRGLLALRGSPARGWQPGEVLLLLPIGSFVAGLSSAGGHFQSVTAPAGVFALLLPLAVPSVQSRRWVMGPLLTVAVIVAVSTIGIKVRAPFAWLTYVDEPMFTHRTVYRHPAYGPMVISEKKLSFIHGVCDQIKQNGGAQDQLLSIPFPYANYFCALPPWHGYVQTFFDTSSPDTITRLQAEVAASPPRWILYQRQMDVLLAHEAVFNDKRPLPQRELDSLIVSRLASGRWKEVSEFDVLNPDESHAEWMLVDTAP